MTTPHSEGTWPYVDIVVIKDYKQDKTDKEPTHTLRIHMDIPMTADQLRAVDGHLTNRNNRGVLDAVLGSGANVPPNSTGLATLAAALGLPQMDRSPLPPPKTKSE